MQGRSTGPVKKETIRINRGKEMVVLVGW